MVENEIQITTGITTNVDGNGKNIIYVEKIVFGILLHAFAKMIASFIKDSMIMCDEIIEETKNIPTNFNEKSNPFTQYFCILLSFLLIIIALLMAVSIYCYLI